jgi:hypothetical protein
VALFFLVLGGFFAGYWRFVHYERRALNHVPPDALFAIRLDLQQVVLFEPVRRHLFPLLDELPWGPGGMAQVRELSGVNLSMDLREIVFAVRPGGGWVLAAAGLMDAARLEQAVASVLNASVPGICGPHSNGHRCGFFSLVTTEDNTLLLGSDEPSIESARAESIHYESLQMNKHAAVSWGLKFQGSSELPIWAGLEPLLSNGVARLNGEIELSDPLGVVLRLPAEPTQATAGAGAGAVLEGLRATARELPESSRGELLALLSQATVTTEGNTAAVRSTWSRESMTEAIERLAVWIRQR